MPRSLKKGPFVDDHLMKKVDVQNERGSKTVIRNLVPAFHGRPGDAGAHDRRA